MSGSEYFKITLRHKSENISYYKSLSQIIPRLFNDNGIPISRRYTQNFCNSNACDALQQRLFFFNEAKSNKKYKLIVNANKRKRITAFEIIEYSFATISQY